MLRIRTIDAHAAGEPLRLIVDGFPTPDGDTMLEKREWVRAHADALRRTLMLEPRGHLDMYGALLTEPVTAGAQAGVLFMHNEGYSSMCGHGIIAVVTIALERRLVHVSTDPHRIRLDSPAGVIVARATTAPSAGAPGRCGVRVERVAFANVPSFALQAGLPIRVRGREVLVDVAFGGAFYAIVDAEAAGLPVHVRHLPRLREVGMEIKHAVEEAIQVTHPLEPRLHGIYGTIFTGVPESPRADLRNVTIFADGQVDRSPCGTGTSAVMAVLDAMGLLPADRAFVHESLIGTLFTGRVVDRADVDGIAAIVPEVEGSAWITGEHTFYVDDADPLREGFRI